MLGRVERTLDETGTMFAIAGEGFRRTWDVKSWWREWLVQCWFLVRVTTLPVMLIAIPLGATISLQVGQLARQLGAGSATGSAVVLAIVREVAPVATALLISGAGGSAMSSDLGSRRIRDELAAMEVMGVNPIQRLVMPRILAATVLALLLDGVTSVAGIAGGWFFGVKVQGVSSSSFFASFDELSQPWDLWMALIKAACFGFLAGTVACYKGLFAKGGPKGVGDAVNQAVVITFVLLFFVNFVLTLVYFNFIPQKV